MRNKMIFILSFVDMEDVGDLGSGQKWRSRSPGYEPIKMIAAPLDM
jgi:hypothetical protein